MKKIVILHNKQTGEETPFPTVARLIRETDKELLGIGKGALWNALSRNGGIYENMKVRVFYKHIEAEPKTWE
jgi:hypothetical protein